MLASLGKDPTDEYLEAMMNEAPGAINFTMFLTLFGERLQGQLVFTYGWIFKIVLDTELPIQANYRDRGQTWQFVIQHVT